MASPDEPGKANSLARELIHLHGEEINFRNPIELEVPPANWPDPLTRFIASSHEILPENDPRRISFISHRDTFSLEATQSIQRLERIAELEKISTVKVRANQILDRTLTSFNVSDERVTSLGQDNIGVKCHQILVEGAKQQNPELFREPTETVAFEIVTDVDSSGHIESTLPLLIPVDIGLVQTLERLETCFIERNGVRPSQLSPWKYETPTGEVIGLVSDAELKTMINSFKHSETTPLLWHSDVFKADPEQLIPKRKPMTPMTVDEPNIRQWVDDSRGSPVNEDGLPFFSPPDEMPQRLEDYPGSMIQTLKELASMEGRETPQPESESNRKG